MRDGLRVSGGVVPVMLYHDVVATPVRPSFRRFVVPPTLFAEHMAALREAGYVTARVSDLPDAQVGQRVFMTFDDGFASIVEHALPTLVALGMTATLYLPSSLVGGRAAWLAPEGEEGRRLLAWSDVRDAVAAGFEIGSHGQRHLELDMLTEPQLERELVTSRRILEDEINRVVDTLAYPFGYNNAHVRSAARAAGYRTACEVGWGLHPLGRDVFRIRRFVVEPQISGEQLVTLLAEDRPSLSQRARRHSGPAWRMARRARAAIRRPSID